MKSTGIVRKVDGLGRIVLPIELRRVLDVQVHSDLEIYVDGDSIVLRKYNSSCVFCGGTNGLVDFEEKKVCSGCLEKLSAAK